MAKTVKTAKSRKTVRSTRSTPTRRVTIGSKNKRSLSFSSKYALVVAAIFGVLGVAWLVLTFAATETLTFSPKQLVTANTCGEQPRVTKRAISTTVSNSKRTSTEVMRLPVRDAACENAPMVQVDAAVIGPKLVGKLNSKVKVCVEMRASEGTGTAGIRLVGTSDDVARDVTVPGESMTVLCGTEATLTDEKGNLRISNRGTEELYIRKVTYTVTSPTSLPIPVPTPTTYGPVSRSAPTTAYVTPEQFGAVGDGVTDSTNALENALKAAEGKILWLPADKTYISKRIQSVPSNTTVMGAGKTSKIKFTWVDDTSPDSGGNSYMRAKGYTATNIHFTNFVLEGGGDGLPSGLKADNPQGLVPMLRLSRVNNLSVKNMEILKSTGLGISCSGCTNGVFQYNYVHNTGRDGITMYRDQEQNVYDILIDNNYIEKTGDDSIAINGLVPGQNLPREADGSSPLQKRLTITNNIIDGWHTDPNGKHIGRGIALNGVAGALVKDNSISYPAGTGILLTGCNNHDCDVSDIWWRSSGAQVINNKINYSDGGSRPGAIAIRETENSTLTGNVATYSRPYDFSGCFTGCSISGNTETNVLR